MRTKVVNLRLEKCDVKICRTQDGKIPDAPQNGCFGNPFFLKNTADLEERNLVISKYKKYFLEKIASDTAFKKAVLDLRGKTLGCFCKNKEKEVPCHGDVIVEWLENNLE